MPTDRRPRILPGDRSFPAGPPARPVLFVALSVATPVLVAGHVAGTTPCRHARRVGCYPDASVLDLAAILLVVLGGSLALAAGTVALVRWADRRVLGDRLSTAGERPAARFLLAPGRRALAALAVVLALAVAAVASGPVAHPPASPALRPVRRVALFVLYLPSVLSIAGVDLLARHFDVVVAPVEAGIVLDGAVLGALPQVAWWYGLAGLASRDRTFLTGADRDGIAATPEKRRIAVVAVAAIVVLAAGVGAVRTLDPGPPDYETTTVDGSAPPDELVLDALRQVEQGRYTVDVVVSTRDSGGRFTPVEAPPAFEGRPIAPPGEGPPPARRLHVDVPDRQVRIARLHGDGAETTWFGNARLGWRHDDRWRVHPAGYGGAWTYPLTLLLNEDAVVEDHAEFSVVARNDTALVARMDGDAASSNFVDANVGGDFSWCRFVVDLEIDRLRRVTCRSSQRVLDLRFSDWGRDHPRPGGARYSLQELVLDVEDVGEIHDTAPLRTTPAHEESTDDHWDREDE